MATFLPDGKYVQTFQVSLNLGPFRHDERLLLYAMLSETGVSRAKELTHQSRGKDDVSSRSLVCGGTSGRNQCVVLLRAFASRETRNIQ